MKVYYFNEITGKQAFGVFDQVVVLPHIFTTAMKCKLVRGTKSGRIEHVIPISHLKKVEK